MSTIFWPQVQSKRSLKKTSRSIGNGKNPWPNLSAKNQSPTWYSNWQKNRSSSMPVASDSATHVAPSAVPTASSINLPEGRTLNINVNRGENDPAKKVPVEPKRSYIKKNWEEGCPYCGKILLSYNSYRQHVSYQCNNKPNFNWTES